MSDFKIGNQNDKDTSIKKKSTDKSSNNNLPDVSENSVSDIHRSFDYSNSALSSYLSSDMNISDPMDSSELEADRIANEIIDSNVLSKSPIENSISEDSAPIMRKISTDTSSDGYNQINRSVSNTCGLYSSGVSQDAIHRKLSTSVSGNTSSINIQRKVTVSDNSKPISRSMSAGASASLPKSLQSGFEDAFGTSLSHVRIHNDSNADKISRSINADAFTHGSDIYFKNGFYDPSSKSGQHLIAHELTHVVQNNKGISRSISDPTQELKSFTHDEPKEKQTNSEDEFFDQFEKQSALMEKVKANQKQISDRLNNILKFKDDTKEGVDARKAVLPFLQLPMVLKGLLECQRLIEKNTNQINSLPKNSPYKSKFRAKNKELRLKQKKLYREFVIMQKFTENGGRAVKDLITEKYENLEKAKELQNLLQIPDWTKEEENEKKSLEKKLQRLNNRPSTYKVEKEITGVKQQKKQLDDEHKITKAQKERIDKLNVDLVALGVGGNNLGAAGNISKEQINDYISKLQREIDALKNLSEASIKSSEAPDLEKYDGQNNVYNDVLEEIEVGLSNVDNVKQQLGVFINTLQYGGKTELNALTEEMIALDSPQKVKDFNERVESLNRDKASQVAYASNLMTELDVNSFKMLGVPGVSSEEDIEACKNAIDLIKVISRVNRAMQEASVANPLRDVKNIKKKEIDTINNRRGVSSSIKSVLDKIRVCAETVRQKFIELKDELNTTQDEFEEYDVNITKQESNEKAALARQLLRSNPLKGVNAQNFDARKNQIVEKTKAAKQRLLKHANKTLELFFEETIEDDEIMQTTLKDKSDELYRQNEMNDQFDDSYKVFNGKDKTIFKMFVNCLKYIKKAFLKEDASTARMFYKDNKDAISKVVTSEKDRSVTTSIDSSIAQQNIKSNSYPGKKPEYEEYLKKYSNPDDAKRQFMYDLTIYNDSLDSFLSEEGKRVLAKKNAVSSIANAAEVSVKSISTIVGEQKNIKEKNEKLKQLGITAKDAGVSNSISKLKQASAVFGEIESVSNAVGLSAIGLNLDNKSTNFVRIARGGSSAAGAVKSVLDAIAEGKQAQEAGNSSKMSIAQMKRLLDRIQKREVNNGDPTVRKCIDGLDANNVIASKQEKQKFGNKFIGFDRLKTDKEMNKKNLGKSNLTMTLQELLKVGHKMRPLSVDDVRSILILDSARVSSILSESRHKWEAASAGVNSFGKMLRAFGGLFTFSSWLGGTLSQIGGYFSLAGSIVSSIAGGIKAIGKARTQMLEQTNKNNPGQLSVGIINKIVAIADQYPDCEDAYKSNFSTNPRFSDKDKTMIDRHVQVYSLLKAANVNMLDFVFEANMLGEADKQSNARIEGDNWGVKEYGIDGIDGNEVAQRKIALMGLIENSKNR